jgi:hypothetical protein
VRLTANQVRQIYGLLASNKSTHAEIADELGCSRVTVTYINQGRYHKHLAPPGWKPSPPLYACGSRNGFAKLSEEEAREVYRLAWTGDFTLRQIGEAFGISLSQVHLIKTKREWKYLWRKDNQSMTDNTDDLRAEIDKLRAETAELKAELARLIDAAKPPAPMPREPYAPIDYTARASVDAETTREWAKVIPDSLARQLRDDALNRPNPVTGVTPAQLTPGGGGGVQIRGSGWQEPSPLRSPADRAGLKNLNRGISGVSA